MATFEVDGRTFTAITTGMLDISELSWIKEQYGIGGLVELEEGVEAIDPDAWSALLAVAMRRDDPSIGRDDETLGKVNLYDVIQALNKEAVERREKAMREEAERVAAQEAGRPRKPGAAGGGKKATSARSGGRSGRSGSASAHGK